MHMYLYMYIVHGVCIHVLQVLIFNRVLLHWRWCLEGWGQWLPYHWPGGWHAELQGTSYWNCRTGVCHGMHSLHISTPLHSPSLSPPLYQGFIGGMYRRGNLESYSLVTRSLLNLALHLAREPSHSHSLLLQMYMYLKVQPFSLSLPLSVSL